jgi:hypothetical protein
VLFVDSFMLMIIAPRSDVCSNFCYEDSPARGPILRYLKVTRIVPQCKNLSTHPPRLFRYCFLYLPVLAQKSLETGLDATLMTAKVDTHLLHRLALSGFFDKSQII